MSRKSKKIRKNRENSNFPFFSAAYNQETGDRNQKAHHDQAQAKGWK
jgi:hypothetical protein